MTIVNLSLRRREFLGAGAAAAGALLLGFALPPARAAAREAGGIINAFVAIDPDGVVTFLNPFAEMGQGTNTSIPMLVAEELDIDMSSLRVEQAPVGAEYRIQFNKTLRITGGSSSVRSSFDTLRRVGASARVMLIEAAAEKWGVSAGDLSTEPGFVIHAKSGRRASYGDLASAAAKLSPPEQVVLKDMSRFRLLGKPVARTDAHQKSSGRALFGIDVHEKDMLVAAVRQSPVFGGKVKSVDRSKLKGMPGVAGVEEIANGVAVLADNYWHAQNALDALPVTFVDAPHPDFSSSAHLEKLRSRLSEDGHPAESIGDVKSAFSSAAKIIEAEYHAPFLAHVTMETQNCTALVKDGRCTVWAPNQGPDFVAQTAARIANLPVNAVDVVTPFLGGGFGRRVVMDYVEQAVSLATRYPGRLVKVVWSREEDTQHDFYRPLIAARFRAAFDTEGRPVALHVTTAGDGPGRQIFPQFLQDPNLDDSVYEGSHEQPYQIPNRRLDFVFELSPAPLGFWRSVGHSQNAFFKESFIDEMAHSAGRDPVEFRRALLQEQPRFRTVLDTVAKTAGWRGGKWKAADGTVHAMGVALHQSFGSIVAEIAEASLNDAQEPVVHKVWCATDCGFAVNPLVLEHQIESAIAYGLSAALHEEIMIKDGRVTNANFDSYPILSAQEMPDVEVKIVNGGDPMGGIGEVATPPIAPAVCNALFALTGVRIRSLPLSSHTFTS